MEEGHESQEILMRIATISYRSCLELVAEDLLPYPLKRVYL